MSKSSTSSGVSKRTTRSTKRRQTVNNVVSRIFHEDHLTRNVPRFTTVAYTHNIKTGETRYGASLFRAEVPNEVINVFGTKRALRAALRRTATGRLEKKPVQIELSSKSIKDLHSQLRKAVFIYGVSS